MTLFYGLVLSHLIADFMQPAALVKWSKNSIYGLGVHVLAYAFLSAIVLLGYPLWGFWLAVLAITHFATDRLKYFLSPRLPGWELHLFLVDQVVHVIIIALVAFTGLGSLPLSQSSLFINQIAPYRHYLPLITGYVIATFSVSILVFEADRAIAVRKGNFKSGIIVTFTERLIGILERAAAITVVLVNNLFFLFPVAFAVTISKLFKNKDNRPKIAVELAISAISALVIAVALRYFAPF